MRRVFFAIWPPLAVSNALAELASDAAPRCGGRQMRRETLHLTLAFIGNVEQDRIRDLEGAADSLSAKACELVLDEMAYWPRNRIVWCGTKHPPMELMSLAEQLGRALDDRGFKTDKRPFAVHVTVLRNARCRDDGWGDPTPIVWPIREFVLVESNLKPEGASYTILRGWPLAAG